MTTPCRIALTAVVLLTCGTGLTNAQPNFRATHFVWALDAGTSAVAPSLRVYTPDGTEVSNVPLSGAGSGQVRAFDFDSLGRGYLCRGNGVYQLDPMGVPTGIVMLPPSGASAAQDVCELNSGDILVSWGVSAATSFVSKHSPNTGSLLRSYQSSMFDHPRRIAANPRSGSTTVFVANRTTNTIVSFDHSAVAPTFTMLSSLTTPNVGPVGLAWDQAHGFLWVASDWGQANALGSLDALAANPLFNSAFTYPGAAMGLRAPGGIFYDRFRRLYVAGRNVNNGVAGVYVFNATATGSLTSITRFPNGGANPGNILDVSIQALDAEICAPIEDATSTYILRVGMQNRVTFSGATLANQTYAAALSSMWPSVCGAPGTNIGMSAGPLAASLTFASVSSDPRGLPFIPDGIFTSTVGVAIPAQPSLLGGTLAPFVLITGFFGQMDPTGFREAFIDLTPLGPFVNLGLDGLVLNLAFFTFDPTTSSNFGVISQPVCLTLRHPAEAGSPPLGSVTLCP